MAALPTRDNLSAIKVLTYLEGTFWGIPYGMRDGQQPADIGEQWRHHEKTAWVWLGSPSWYGSMNQEQKDMAQRFLQDNRSDMPWYDGAWIDLTETVSA